MTTKICTKCGEEKELSEFHKRKTIKDGHALQCKKCKSIYDRKYREDNEEKLKEKDLEYRKNNKEKIAKRKKLWSDSHKEELKIKHAEWHKNNKKEVKQKRAKYYADNREYFRIRNAKWRENNRRYKNSIDRIWKQNNPIKVRKSIARRKRELGYNPLNKKFEGSVGHHINKNDIIYIPEHIHKSIPHRQDDLVSMEQINQLAMGYI